VDHLRLGIAAQEGSGLNVQDHRHFCEVRYVLKMRTKSQESALAYIELVTARRGREAGQRLRDDCSKQWSRGNKGEWGSWK